MLSERHRDILFMIRRDVVAWESYIVSLLGNHILFRWTLTIICGICRSAIPQFQEKQPEVNECPYQT